MKRHILVSISALCAIAACTLASCGRIEEVPANEPEIIEEPAAPQISFTATLAAKGEDPQSKAITTGTEGGKEVLNVAWEVNEKIALYYETSSGHATAEATVTAVNEGVATIQASLDANTVDGGAVRFVYPASLVNATGDDIDESKLMTQYGKINGIANSISKKFDAATGDGKIVLGGGTDLPATATVTNPDGTGDVSLHSRVCICKFHLTIYIINANGTLSTLYSGTNDDLTINDGNGHTYTIKSWKSWGDVTPVGVTGNPGYATGDDIYVAMLPIENKPLTLSLTYKDNSVTKNLTLTTGAGTLAAGKFYRNVPVTMQLEDMDVKGEITHTLTVPAGMTVTVNGANINTTSAPAIVLEDKAKLILKGENSIRTTYANAIECSGNATIEFQSTTNTVTAVAGSDSAIHIADGKSLNITGSGSTSVSGGIDLQSSAYLKFNGTAASHDIYIPDGVTLSSSGVGISSTVAIFNGETFTLSWTTINVTSGPGILCEGNASIILDGTNNVTTTAEGYPAIQAGGSGTTLTIQGGGSVSATGAQFGAGIGGRYDSSSDSICGNIVITSGTVTANGGEEAAGIGSGGIGSKAHDSICGDITISGGTVTANGGKYGAGIGSGSDNPSLADNISTCGNITINGGTVTASGGKWGAGIGSGSDSTCGNITISGGTVEANSGQSGAGIGSGSGSDANCGAIAISGGTVTATGGIYGAGIGSGADGSCGTITISGGTGIYTGGRYAAGIGCSYESICGDITITDGVTRVTATRYDFDDCPYSIGLGSGLYSATYTCGTITIGGTVYYDGKSFKNEGDTYLATSPLIYQP